MSATPRPSGPRPWGAHGLRVAALLAFAVLVGRNWHPYYGFTSLLQLDRSTAAHALPVIAERPVFVHEDLGAYDGVYYAQIATDPTLRDPALRRAIDSPAYRAQRILLPAFAWLAGFGQPIAAIHAYAWLNVVAWFVLALLLWRVFPAGEPRATLAWLLLLATGGVLLSVRLSLTDLPALALTVGAVRLVERQRFTGAGACLASAALTRETAVLGAAALFVPRRRPWQDPAWPRRVLALAIALAAILVWQLYVRRTLGAPGAGTANLMFPLAGWFARWLELGRSYAAVANPRLWVESLLEHVALTIQVIYLVRQRRPDCPWWRIGAVAALLGLVLGTAVWEGFPNAASRLLLPVTLAFNVRLVRDRAPLAWFLAGNLACFAGLHALTEPVGLPRVLPATWTWSQRALLETDSRWAVAEATSKWRWAWCSDRGGVTLRVWPWAPSARIDLQLRGITPRTIEVRHRNQVVWRGSIGDRPQWISLPELPLVNGRLDLELSSDTPGKAENDDATARRISFACFGARYVR